VVVPVVEAALVAETLVVMVAVVVEAAQPQLHLQPLQLARPTPTQLVAAQPQVLQPQQAVVPVAVVVLVVDPVVELAVVEEQAVQPQLLPLLQPETVALQHLQVPETVLQVLQP